MYFKSTLSPLSLSLPQPLVCLGATVTGIDPVEESIAAVQQHSGSDPAVSDKIKYLCCSTDQLLAANPETMFNCVVASEVIEHVTEKRTFLQEVSQLVKVLHMILIHAHTHTCTHAHTHAHTLQDMCTSAVYFLFLARGCSLFHHNQSYNGVLSTGNTGSRAVTGVGTQGYS